MSYILMLWEINLSVASMRYTINILAKHKLAFEDHHLNIEG